MNIPTAEEYLDKKYPDFDNLDSGNIWVNIEQTMIEFAKLHVKAALKAASNKVEIHSDSGSNYHKEFEEGIRNKTIWIPGNSILEAYPLENIK